MANLQQPYFAGFLMRLLPPLCAHVPSVYFGRMWVKCGEKVTVMTSSAASTIIVSDSSHDLFIKDQNNRRRVQLRAKMLPPISRPANKYFAHCRIVDLHPDPEDPAQILPIVTNPEDFAADSQGGHGSRMAVSRQLDKLISHIMLM
jgi:hypothetical protein